MFKSAIKKLTRAGSQSTASLKKPNLIN